MFSNETLAECVPGIVCYSRRRRLICRFHKPIDTVGSPVKRWFGSHHITHRAVETI